MAVKPDRVKPDTKKDEPWFVYLLECSNNKIYTGITTNLARRFQRHASGRGAKFTKFNPPSHFIAAKKCKNRSEASKLEREIKELKAFQKRRLALEWPFLKELP
jgi:putative endonuclease